MIFTDIVERCLLACVHYKHTCRGVISGFTVFLATHRETNHVHKYNTYTFNSISLV